MTVLNFPDTSGKPTDGSFIYVANNVIYTWDGDKWTSSAEGSNPPDVRTGNLQEVTDLGNTTTNGIEVGNITAAGTIEAGEYSLGVQGVKLHNGYVEATNTSTGYKVFVGELNGVEKSSITAGGSITAAGSINVGGDTSSTTTHGIFAFNNSSTNTHAAVYARNMQAGGQVWAGLSSVGNQTSSINEDGSAKFSGPVETYRVGKSPGVIYFPSDPAIPAGLSVLSSYIYNGSSGSTDGTYFASTPFASASDLTALMANDGSFRLGGTLPSAPNITLAADGSATFANVNGGYSIMTMPAGGDAANWGCFNGALADGTQTSTIRADGSAKFADGNITLAADGSATFAGQVEVKEAGTTNRTIIAGRTLFGYSGPDNADQKYTIDAQTGNAIFAGTVTAGSFDLEALPSLPA